jgi:hypothetical protein
MGKGPALVVAVVLAVGDDGVVFDEDSYVTFPADGNVNGAAGTIQFEIEPQQAGSDKTSNSLVQTRNEHVWENRLQLVKNFNSLRFVFIDNTGQGRKIGAAGP